MTDKLKSDCKERVAFDMALKIWSNEQHSEDAYRKEFLKLYTECYAAVRGHKAQIKAV